MVHGTLARAILKRVAKAVAKRGAERIIEEATGTDIPDLPDLIRAIENAIEQRDAVPAEQAVENAVDSGDLPPRAIDVAEQAIMTDFNDFMSIGLEQCGTDRQTFADLVEVWKNEKDDIKQMSQREVRENLTCP